MKESILVVGASGQLGTVITGELIKHYGSSQVIASDIRENSEHDCPFVVLDATDYDRVAEVVRQHQVTQIYHLAAILSASGEQMPMKAWAINTQSLLNTLEVSRHSTVQKVFHPSSIAVYGYVQNESGTSELSLTPSTVYGVSKIAGEKWSHYYHSKYGLDVRSLRYPGVIGHQSIPSGGTTDYAVDMYHKAVNNEVYTCYLDENSTLPMIYMADAVRATLELMEAPEEKVKLRTSYDVSGLSFSPKELYESIKELKPEFEIQYESDFRQEIANNWPRKLDDSRARHDWDWQPAYGMQEMTKEMIQILESRYSN